ncbi:MAG: transglutaminase-like domain-containing protein [Bacilli bacterium]|jgi:hypothetical protein|nr:transglutaminase-like domain-containing protein [Bacilli bacterium]
MLKVTKRLFLFSILLLASCAQTGGSSSNSLASTGSESSASETTSSGSSSIFTPSSSSEEMEYLPSGAEDYFLPIPSGDDFNVVCENIQQYIDLLDAHLFNMDTSFTIAYSFIDSGSSARYDYSSLWNINLDVDFKTTPRAGKYIDTYTIDYRDYGIQNQGTELNATETLSVVDDIFLNRGEKRNEGFSDFPINGREHSISVSTSEQLWYAASRGYLPIPVAGSKAEVIYEEALDIAREYISSDDSDVEKERKIFAWLGNDILYDYTAYEKGYNGVGYQYQNDCYYLEGIFNRHIAVCDGMSKALVLLSSIEDIPAVRVTGYVIASGQGAGHAWNYVQLGGEWYAACPTSNNTMGEISDVLYELGNKELFLVSNATIDAVYKQTSFPLAKADSDYGFYANTTIEYNDFTHDLVAKNAADVVKFVQLLADYPSVNDEKKVMNFQYVDGLDVNTAITQARSETGLSFGGFIGSDNELILITL